MKEEQKKQIRPHSGNDMENFAESAARGASDVLGSYTGIAADPFETPVQDADDL